MHRQQNTHQFVKTSFENHKHKPRQKNKGY
jgi:hypothetical protein